MDATNEVTEGDTGNYDIQNVPLEYVQEANVFRKFFDRLHPDDLIVVLRELMNRVPYIDIRPRYERVEKNVSMLSYLNRDVEEIISEEEIMESIEKNKINECNLSQIYSMIKTIEDRIKDLSTEDYKTKLSNINAAGKRRAVLDKRITELEVRNKIKVEKMIFPLIDVIETKVKKISEFQGVINVMYRIEEIFKNEDPNFSKTPISVYLEKLKEMAQSEEDEDDADVLYKSIIEDSAPLTIYDLRLTLDELKQQLFNFLEVNETILSSLPEDKREDVKNMIEKTLYSIFVLKFPTGDEELKNFGDGLENVKSLLYRTFKLKSYTSNTFTVQRNFQIWVEFLSNIGPTLDILRDDLNEKIKINEAKIFEYEEDTIFFKELLVGINRGDVDVIIKAGKLRMREYKKRLGLPGNVSQKEFGKALEKKMKEEDETGENIHLVTTIQKLDSMLYSLSTLKKEFKENEGLTLKKLIEIFKKSVREIEIKKTEQQNIIEKLRNNIAKAIRERNTVTTQDGKTILISEAIKRIENEIADLEQFSLQLNNKIHTTKETIEKLEKQVNILRNVFEKNKKLKESEVKLVDYESLFFDELPIEELNSYVDNGKPIYENKKLSQEFLSICEYLNTFSPSLYKSKSYFEFMKKLTDYIISKETSVKTRQFAALVSKSKNIQKIMNQDESYLRDQIKLSLILSSHDLSLDYTIVNSGEFIPFISTILSFSNPKDVLTRFKTFIAGKRRNILELWEEFVYGPKIRAMLLEIMGTKDKLSKKKYTIKFLIWFLLIKNISDGVSGRIVVETSIAIVDYLSVFYDVKDIRSVGEKGGKKLYTLVKTRKEDFNKNSTQYTNVAGANYSYWKSILSRIFSYSTDTLERLFDRLNDPMYGNRTLDETIENVGSQIDPAYMNELMVTIGSDPDLIDLLLTTDVWKDKAYKKKYPIIYDHRFFSNTILIECLFYLSYSKETRSQKKKQKLIKWVQEESKKQSPRWYTLVDLVKVSLGKKAEAVAKTRKEGSRVSEEQKKMYKDRFDITIAAIERIYKDIYSDFLKKEKKLLPKRGGGQLLKTRAEKMASEKRLKYIKSVLLKKVEDIDLDNPIDLGDRFVSLVMEILNQDIAEYEEFVNDYITDENTDPFGSLMDLLYSRQGAYINSMISIDTSTFQDIEGAKNSLFINENKLRFFEKSFWSPDVDYELSRLKLIYGDKNASIQNVIEAERTLKKIRESEEQSNSKGLSSLGNVYELGNRKGKQKGSQSDELLEITLADSDAELFNGDDDDDGGEDYGEVDEFVKDSEVDDDDPSFGILFSDDVNVVSDEIIRRPELTTRAQLFSAIRYYREDKDKYKNFRIAVIDSYKLKNPMFIVLEKFKMWKLFCDAYIYDIVNLPDNISKNVSSLYFDELNIVKFTLRQIEQLKSQIASEYAKKVDRSEHIEYLKEMINVRTRLVSDLEKGFFSRSPKALKALQESYPGKNNEEYIKIIADNLISDVEMDPSNVLRNLILQKSTCPLVYEIIGAKGYIYAVNSLKQRFKTTKKVDMFLRSFINQQPVEFQSSDNIPRYIKTTYPDGVVTSMIDYLLIYRSEEEKKSDYKVSILRYQGEVLEFIKRVKDIKKGKAKPFRTIELYRDYFFDRVYFSILLDELGPVRFFKTFYPIFKNSDGEVVIEDSNTFKKLAERFKNSLDTEFKTFPEFLKSAGIEFSIEPIRILQRVEKPRVITTSTPSSSSTTASQGISVEDRRRMEVMGLIRKVVENANTNAARVRENKEPVPLELTLSEINKAFFFDRRYFKLLYNTFRHIKMFDIFKPLFKDSDGNVTIGDEEAFRDLANGFMNSSVEEFPDFSSYLIANGIEFYPSLQREPITLGFEDDETIDSDQCEYCREELVNGVEKTTKKGKIVKYCSVECIKNDSF